MLHWHTSPKRYFLLKDALFGSTHSQEELFRQTADNNSSFELLHRAFESGFLDLVLKSLPHMAKYLDHPDGQGRIILNRLAYAIPTPESCRLAERLILLGANVSATDHKDCNIFHVVCSTNNLLLLTVIKQTINNKQ